MAKLPGKGQEWPSVHPFLAPALITVTGGKVCKNNYDSHMTHVVRRIYQTKGYAVLNKCRLWGTAGSLWKTQH